MIEAVPSTGKRSAAGTKAKTAEGSPTETKGKATEHSTRLIIEEPEVEQLKTEPKKSEPGTTSATTAKKTTAKATKIGSLEHIRQQFANSQGDAANNRPVPLSDELLKTSWQAYTDILKEKKNPAVQSFDLARLTITSENTFEVLTNNNLEHRFIEQERRFLSEFLQQKFNNRSLNYSISVSEAPVHHIPMEKTLNKKEQFLQIVEQYPLIRELKDRLKLELDY